MKKNAALKIAVEMMSIIFLFYANLLMGQYTPDRLRQQTSLIQAISHIFSAENFLIAVIAAFVGHLLFDRLRSKL